MGCRSSHGDTGKDLRDVSKKDQQDLALETRERSYRLFSGLEPG